MQDQNSSQLELFTKPAGNGRQREAKSFFGYIRGHEKVILFLIALVVTGIISFSMGVENGKRLAVSQSAARFDMAAATEAPTMPVKPAAAAPSVIVTPLKQPGQKAQQIPKKEQAARPKNGAYTIQLASYNNKATAQKEYNALRKKGFSALIIPNGKYAVLCVGNFSTKEGAQSLLAEFKKRYKTCYIRRF